MPRIPGTALCLILAFGWLPETSRGEDGQTIRFFALRDLDGGQFLGSASAISADGSLVFGGGRRWSKAEGIVELAGIPDLIAAVSDDGSVIVGSGTPPTPFATLKAFRWTFPDGVRFLGDLPGGASLSQAFGVSADGSVVVGLGSVETTSEANPLAGEAFRWTQAGGMVGLGVLEGFLESEARDVSADGSVVVGTSGGPLAPPIYPHQAFRWTAAEGMVGLPSLIPGTNSGAVAISGDGRVIVGWSDYPYPRRDAVLWKETGDVLRLGSLFEPPPCCVVTVARAVSRDGSVVVGSSQLPGGRIHPSSAFIWDAAHGIRNLQAILEAAGLDLTGWFLSEATAISDDGRSIAGDGFNPDGQQEAWLVVFPEPDGDADGIPDSQDDCSATPPGDPVDPDTGCSVFQLCPCNGPHERDTAWRNHGKYVKCVVRVAERFAREGILDRAEKRSLIREAARTACGKRARRTR